MADNKAGARRQADRALVAGDQAAERLDPPGFDPSREMPVISRAGAALKASYEYVRSDKSPLFEDLDSGHRIVALAAAMFVAEPLLRALREIAAMKTPSANATVRRMAERAASAIEARRVETERLDAQHESAVAKPDAQPSGPPSGDPQ